MKPNQPKAFLLVEDFNQGEPSLFGLLTSKSPPETANTLSNSTYRISAEREDVYVLAAPKDMKAMYSMCVLADVLIVAFSLEYLSNEIQAKRFQNRTILAYVTGVKQVITCINDPSPTTEVLTPQLFNELSTQVHTTLRKVGVQIANTLIIPISTARGTNVTASSSDFSWYPGPTLATALQSINLLSRKPSDSLQLAVRDVFQRDGLVVCCGRVLRGSLHQGDTILVRPQMKPAQVVSIGSFGNLVSNAQAGDICGVGLAGVNIKDISRGAVLSSPSEAVGEIVSCTVQVIVLDHNSTVCWGYEAFMHLGCAAVPIRIERIQQLIDRRSGKVMEEFPKQLKPGEAGILQLVPKKSIVAHRFAEIPVFGRFLISNCKKIVMVGVVKDVNKYGIQV